jgi:hypothetical protein
VSTKVTHTVAPNAGAQYTDLADDRSGLTLYLNSITLVITGPPNPHGDQLLMDFCVQLSNAAALVADELNLKLHTAPRKLWDESQSHDH